MKRTCFCIFILSVISPSVYALTYQAAIDAALTQAPQIQAQQNEVLANQSSEVSSGRLPDPNLVLGIDNLPISGQERFSTTADFMTMKKVGIMQDIPNGDKRLAEKKIASAKTQIAQHALANQTLAMKRDTGLAWLTLYYIEQKQQINKTRITSNQSLIQSLTKTVQSGRVNNQTELLAAEQQKDELLDQRDLLNLNVIRAQNELRRFVGDSASMPLTGTGKPPRFVVHSYELMQKLHRHPELAQFAAKQNQAKAELLLAKADKKPDWSVGVSYQNRGPAFGDMASLEVKVGLPVFSSKRQNPRIAAKKHALTEVDFERETAYRMHHAELASDLAMYDILTKQINRIVQERLPLAQRNIVELQVRYNAAQVAFRDLNEAQQYFYELQMQKVDLQFQRDSIAIKLHYLSGAVA